MTPDERLRKQRDNQDYFSTKLSELSRFMSYGLVAVVFGFITTDNSFFSNMTADHKNDVVLSAIIVILSLFVDYLQHLFGYVGAGAAAKNKANGFERPAIGKFYMWIQTVFFYLKQVAAAWGLVLFVSILARNLTF